MLLKKYNNNNIQVVCMFVREMYVGRRHADIGMFMFDNDFVYGCHRVSICFAWYTVVTELVYVCHRLIQSCWIMGCNLKLTGLGFDL